MAVAVSTAAIIVSEVAMVPVTAICAWDAGYSAIVAALHVLNAMVARTASQ
jgi:hypothetical protein